MYTIHFTIMILYYFTALEGFGGVPPIRPLETLHNALSLRQLDRFLQRVTGSNQAPRTPSQTASGTPTLAACTRDDRGEISPGNNSRKDLLII